MTRVTDTPAKWKARVAAARKALIDEPMRWHDDVDAMTAISVFMDEPPVAAELLSHLPHGEDLSRRFLAVLTAREEARRGRLKDTTALRDSLGRLAARVAIVNGQPWESITFASRLNRDARGTYLLDLDRVSEWKESLYYNRRFRPHWEVVIPAVGHAVSSPLAVLYVFHDWLREAKVQQLEIDGTEVLEDWPRVSAVWHIYAIGRRVIAEPFRASKAR